MFQNFNTIIETESLLIRPLQLADCERMCKLTNDSEMWTYFCSDLSNKWELKNWVLSSLKSNSRFVYTIINKENNSIIGATSIVISKENRTAQMGYTWISKLHQRKGIYSQVVLLLLEHIFEVCNFNKVEFKIDALNTPARMAMLKIGLIEEGFSQKNDEIWLKPHHEALVFSVLNSEWDSIKQNHYRVISA